MVLIRGPHLWGIDRSATHSGGHPHPPPAKHATKYEKRALVIATVALVPSLYVLLGFPTLGEYVKERTVSTQYFRAVMAAGVALNDGTSFSETQALGFASPDSPAARYAKQRQLQSLALEAQGGGGKAWVTEVNMRMFGTRSICHNSDVFEDFCVEISGERFDENHRLADFNLEGVPISEVVLPPGRPEGTKDLAVTVIAGEHSPGSTSTYVVFELVNKSNAKVDLPNTIDYRDATKATKSFSWTGPSSLEPSERALYYANLKGQHPGSVSFTPKIKGSEASPYWIRIP